ncbi:uncharacterized protein SOCE26_038580 [Sorangium cellulosum]|uniref:Uncharacterized protein n=1 Tax=Sorangium cellulosum TaxID=56 RepID=A0A2L0ESZ5_SORCE|nr:CHAT domain-containing protein [Sorangium cellulosum]AUX42426.1 uncharacterized protein SOCE26_038580 [Sorangium cellulosum]
MTSEGGGAVLEITLELARADETGDPYAFRFSDQRYILRREGGAFEEGSLAWSTGLLDDLHRAQRRRPDRAAMQRIGEQLRAFLAATSWRAEEVRIEQALAEGGRVGIAIRSAAAELYALPWELVGRRATGQHLGELPSVLLRYEWPDTKTAPRAPDPPPEHGRILFAWSAAGGNVPAKEHLDAIRRAAKAGYYPFDEDRCVIPHASLQRLQQALRASGPPVHVVHLLCHGGRVPSDTEAYGLVLDGPADGGGPEIVDAGALRQALAEHAGSIRLVVIAACQGADPGAIGGHLGSVAQALHRIGIPAVIASRFPLSAAGSIALADALHATLLGGLGSLEDAFLAARQRLAEQPQESDWASLQLYARRDDGQDRRPLLVRPYRGLQAFGPEHRRLFFGREREVERLAGALRGGKRLLAVVGASGSGKSSLVMAGLAPLMQTAEPETGKPETGSFRVASLRPGDAPCRALADAMAELARAAGVDLGAARAAGAGALREEIERRPEALAEAAGVILSALPGAPRLLLVVDQLEEIFTQGSRRQEAAAFVRALLRATEGDGGRVHVVLTLRADFLGRCLEHDRALAERIRDAMAIVLPMAEHELRAAILRPAERVGLRFEDGLVDAMLEALRADVLPGADGGPGAGDGPGAASLPLLQFALEALWERRRGAMFTWDAWRAIGGLRGAITRRADSMLAQYASDEERAIVRDVFERLVHLGEGTADARRYAPWEEIEATADRDPRALVDRWIRARLLVADEAEVWLAHEALISEWATLRGWINERREALRTRQDLNDDARRWAAEGRSADGLWRGGRLERALELRDTKRMPLSEDERAFLAAAEARRAEELARERAAVEQELARQRTARRRLAWLTAAATLVALVTAALGLSTWWQKQVALKAQADAERAAREARTQSLMAGARGHVARGDFDRAAQLLAAEDAVRAKDWHELARAVLDQVTLLRTHRGHEREVVRVGFSPDGQRIVSASEDGTARIWRTDGGGEPVVLAGHGGPVHTAAFSPDGARIVTASEDGTARVWRADGKGEPILLEQPGREVDSAEFSPDGAHVLVGTGEAAVVWRADGNGAPVVLETRHAQIKTPAFSPDGTRVATGSADRTVKVWHTGPGEPVRLCDRYQGSAMSAALSPDGTRALTWGVTRVEVWSIDATRRPVVLQVRNLGSAAFSPDGTRILTASDGEGAAIWGADGKGEPLSLKGHERRVARAAFSPDGARVATAGIEGTARISAASGEGEVIALKGHGHPVDHVAWSPDGARVLTLSNRTARVWKADGTAEPVVLRATLHEVLQAAFSPDGSRVVTASDDKTARIWSADGKREPVVLEGHAGPVHFAAFSPDGSRVVTTSDDGTARIWSADGKGELAVLERRAGPVRFAAFSPDGSRVVTGSSDGTVRVWDAADAKAEPMLLAGHKAPVVFAQFSLDGSRVLTASEDPRTHLAPAGMKPTGGAPTTGMLLRAATEESAPRLWDLDIPRLQRRLRAVSLDCLPPAMRQIYLGEAPAEAEARHHVCQREADRALPGAPAGAGER